jgi:hypothetical protein
MLRRNNRVAALIVRAAKLNKKNRSIPTALKSVFFRMRTLNPCTTVDPFT